MGREGSLSAALGLAPSHQLGPVSSLPSPEVFSGSPGVGKSLPRKRSSPPTLGSAVEKDCLCLGWAILSHEITLLTSERVGETKAVLALQELQENWGEGLGGGLSCTVDPGGGKLSL